MINLKEHSVFIEKLQMEMVPLTVALKAVEEAYNNSNNISTTLEEIKKAFNSLNNSAND